MDAQTTETQAEPNPQKKTLMLDEATVEWGEKLAKMDHRGCLSNVVKFLIAREWKARMAPNAEKGEVAA